MWAYMSGIDWNNCDYVAVISDPNNTLHSQMHLAYHKILFTSNITNLLWILVSPPTQTQALAKSISSGTRCTPVYLQLSRSTLCPIALRAIGVHYERGIL